MFKTVLRYATILALSVAALWLAFRGQDLQHLLDLMGRVTLWPILLGTMLQFISHAVRAARWRLFLSRANPEVRFGDAFRATLGGFGINNIIPRGGEVARVYMICKGSRVSIPNAVTTMILDRLGDFVGLSALVALSFALYSHEMEQLLSGAPQLGGTLVIGAGVLVGLAVVTWIFRSSFMRTYRAVVPAALQEKISHSIEQMQLAFRGAGLKEINAFVTGSVAIWGLYTLSMYVAIWAFDDPAINNIGFSGFILLQTLAGIAFIVPTPGGTGTYHVVVKAAMMSIFGVPQDVALAYAVLSHGSNYIAATVVGLGIFAMSGARMKAVLPTGAPVAATGDTA